MNKIEVCCIFMELFHILKKLVRTKLTSFCAKLHYKRNLHWSFKYAKERTPSVINCLVSARRRRSYFFSSFNPEAAVYTQRPFRVIRVGGSRGGPFRRKVHLHFCAASIWIYPFIQGGSLCKKGSLACVRLRRYKDVWMNMHVFRSRVC